MSELLPCPFCGGAAEIVGHADGTGEVRCSSWTCSVVFMSHSIERSIERWNRRTAPLATARLLEWLPSTDDDLTRVPASGWYWLQYRPDSACVEWKSKGDYCRARIAGPIPDPREPEGGRDE